ncbi:Hypothetical protein D9617_11g008470 [Elsinoe fawcettii]|nr:Hypothetical protein D9617_11g008470 [Elsinoe fawcettii]
MAMGHSASVWYPDGTAVDIVRIEAGKVYYQYLQDMVDDFLLLSFPDNPGPVCQWAPVWQESTCPTGPHLASPVYPMIAALKKATEEKLGERLCRVMVSLPQPVNAAGRDVVVQEQVDLALAAANLQSPRQAIWSGALAPEILYPDLSTAHDDYVPGKMILAVEYSKDYWSGVLLEESHGVYRNIVGHHYRYFGQRAMDRCRASQPHKDCYSSTRAFLSNMFCGIGEIPEEDELILSLCRSSRLDAIVLYGDAANDQHMRDTLARMLSKAFGEDKVKGLLMPSGIDPAFVAARGAAKLHWIPETGTALHS